MKVDSDVGHYEIFFVAATAGKHLALVVNDITIAVANLFVARDGWVCSGQKKSKWKESYGAIASSDIFR